MFQTVLKFQVLAHMFVLLCMLSCVEYFFKTSVEARESHPRGGPPSQYGPQAVLAASSAHWSGGARIDGMKQTCAVRCCVQNRS